NNDGFKGPDIDKTHSKPRILTIGDSCTFGTMFDEYSYPRTLERELNRMEEFKALRPEITTIYIGWNALYAESFGVEYYLKSVRLFKKAYGKAQEKLFGSTEMALEAYSKPKRVQRDASEVRALDGFQPTFMADMEMIVKEMQSVGSAVVLITLPGLFVMNEEPSQRALKIGHLPIFTDNPYVLAKISTEYNQRLRHLAKSLGLFAVD